MRRILAQIRKVVPAGPFVSNVLKLMTASTLGYVSLLLALPVMSRIYSPEDFGLLGLFWAASSTISVTISAGYEYAIILPENKRDAAHLFVISLLFAVSISIIYLAVVLFFHNEIAGLLGMPQIADLLWLSPPTVFAIGIFNIFTNWLTREKAFTSISIARFFQNFSVAVLQLGFGFYLWTDAKGLIAGLAVGNIIACLFIIWKMDLTPFKQSISISHMTLNMKRYKQFPLYQNVSYLFNSGANQAPFILLAHFFDPIIVGLYSLTIKVLSAPVTFVSKAITPVFMQKLNEVKHATGRTIDVISPIFKRLFLAGLLPMVIVTAFATPLFSFFFGAQWEEAGVYAQILAPLYFLMFIQFPISTTIEIYERLRFRFWEQLIFFLIAIISFGMGGVLESARLCIGIYSFLTSIRYIILIYYIFIMAKKTYQDSQHKIRVSVP